MKSPNFEQIFHKKNEFFKDEKNQEQIYLYFF
jgi:hypothetical protein